MTTFNTNCASANKTCWNYDYGNSVVIIIDACLHHKLSPCSWQTPNLTFPFGSVGHGHALLTKNSLNYLSLAKGDLYLFRGFSFTCLLALFIDLFTTGYRRQGNIFPCYLSASSFSQIQVCCCKAPYLSAVQPCPSCYTQSCINFSEYWFQVAVINWLIRAEDKADDANDIKEIRKSLWLPMKGKKITYKWRSIKTNMFLDKMI